MFLKWKAFSPDEGKGKLGSFWDPSEQSSLIRTRCHLLGLLAAVRNAEQTGLCVSGGHTLLRASKLLPPGHQAQHPLCH